METYQAQRNQPRVTDAPDEPVDEEPSRRWLSILIGFVLVVFILSLIGVFVQRQLDTTGPAQPHDPAPSLTQPGDGEPAPVTIARTIDFDPEADGGNGEENPDEVGLAHDGDPDTRWRTLSYRGNPKLGGLKPGVGLIVDLDEPVDVRKVAVQLSGAGSSLEIRVPQTDAEADQPPMRSQTQWRTVADRTDAEGTVDFEFADDPVRTRWLLVYFTSLPPEDGNYRGGVHEIEVQR